MANLYIPDLCAQLDRIKTLCDRLEAAQGDPQKYRTLIAAIQNETEALQEVVCHISRTDHRPLGLQTS
jgi:hypothetical protein